MGDMEIDIPTKETEDVSIIEEPAPEKVVIEEEAGMPAPAYQQPAPPPKRGVGKVILIVLILVVAAFGAFIVYQMTVPSVNGVQVFVTGENDIGDGLSIRVQVNTGFMSTYDGDETIEVEYDNDKIAEIPVTIRGSTASVSPDYEDFYMDNGDYTFTIEIEGYTASSEQKIIKTAHHIAVGSPTGNNNSLPVTAQPPVQAYSVRTAFTLYTGDNILLDDTVDGNGDGTAYLVDNVTDNTIASTNFVINSADGASTIEVASSSAEAYTLLGGYILDFQFTLTTYPNVDGAYVRIVFTNTYPDSSVSDPVVLDEMGTDYTIA